MNRLALALVACLAMACAGGQPALPSIELPSFDTAAVEQLVEDAMAEVGRLTDSASVELPSGLAALLEEHQIEIPPVPTNAAEICQALGTPGVGTVAAAALRSVIDGFLAGGEVGLAVGVLVSVVVTSCPVWSPHLETAIEQLL